MKKVLIVGGGITSALTSYLLRQKLMMDMVHITVWDKARGPGGRMSTSRSSAVPGCSVDLGLQYITTSPELQSEHEDIYAPLLKENLLEPLKAAISGYMSSRTNVTHYVTPQGSSSVVKFFLTESKPNKILFNTFLETIRKVDADKIEAVSRAGQRETFDVVVLSMPAPQAYELFERSMGDAFDARNVSEQMTAAYNVEYSGRYSLAMYFDELFSPSFDVKYFDDEILRYVSFDAVKRNRKDLPGGVCVHTTPGFYGRVNMADLSPSAIEMCILQKLRELFPDWPLPVETKLHKWKYSQVTKPHPDQLGYMKYNVKPLALCIGDSYVARSDFDNCIYSAKQSVAVLVDEIKS